MNFATGGFWHRFSTALTTATIFVAGFYLYFAMAVMRGNFTTALPVLGLFQLIEVGAIFAIAWPVENFIAKRNIKTLHAGLIYLAIGVGVLAISLPLGYFHLFSDFYTSSFIGAGAFFGTPIAFVARLLYPIMLNYKKICSWVGLVISALSAVTIVSYFVMLLSS